MNYLPIIKELVRAYQGFEGYSSTHIRKLGLTPVQFDVIATLANQPPMSYRCLGERTLISKSSLTGVVERMINRGYVSTELNPEDARSQLLKLTIKGQKIFDKAFPEHIQYLNLAFDQLSKKQLQDMENSLKLLKFIFKVEGK
jgi:MarR family transcriptional regulator, 2-MHQ and catechol-resistance regulon repressor